MERHSVRFASSPIPSRNPRPDEHQVTPLARCDNPPEKSPEIPPEEPQGPSAASFSVEQVDAQHALMHLPPGWSRAELRDAVCLVRGVGCAWIQADVLHLGGPGAGSALAMLRRALLVLQACGVNRVERFLSVLREVPALMTQARSPGVQLIDLDGEVRVHGDAQWCQCVLVNLADTSPALAARFFLALSPPVQAKVLTRYACAFDTMTMRLWASCREGAHEQDLLKRYFRSELQAEMDKGREARPQRLQLWLGRCPAMLGAALHRQWRTHGDEAMKAWWLKSSPALAEALAALDVGDPSDGRGSYSWFVPPSPANGEPMTDEQWDRILEDLRLKEWPSEGSPGWQSGVHYIQYQFRQILSDPDSGETDHDRWYRNALEACNCFLEHDRAALFLHSALSVIAQEAAPLQGDLSGEPAGRVRWLLAQLSRHFGRHFDAVAAHALAQLCTDPETRQIQLLPPLRGPLSTVCFDDTAHVREVLAQMIVLCGARETFQGLLDIHDRVRDQITALLLPLNLEVLDVLAPDGLARAAPRVRFLWRERVIEDAAGAPNGGAAIWALLGRLLLEVVDQKSEPDRLELETLADCLASLPATAATTRSMHSLLERHPDNGSYRRFVIQVIARAADLAYCARRPAWGTKCLAVLCLSPAVTYEQLQAAIAIGLPPLLGFNKAALVALHKLLLGTDDVRAWERACLLGGLLATQSKSLQPLESAEISRYLRDLRRRYPFSHLNTAERAGLAIVSL